MNVLRPQYDCIPTELKARNQWVCWLLKKVESPNGKPPKKPFTKVPICPLTGTTASTTEPTTWTDFGTACNFYQDFADDGGIHGLGFILRDDLIGVDLDGCRDAQSGEIADWATKIIKLLTSYTEISPSGTGIRIFCRGQPQPKGSNRRSGDIEIYDCNSPRYLTVTGWHLDGTPTTIEPRPAELERLYAQVFKQSDEKPAKRPAAQSAAPSLEEIVAVATAAKNGDKFSKLWNGDWEGDYPSQSEADLALAAMLAFYTGPHADLLDDLFRQSGLYRDKWDRDDYRERVLAMAMDRDDFYNWGVSPAVEQLAKEVVARGSIPIKKKAKSQTQRLIEIAEGGELWRTPDYEPYVTISVGGHWENWRLRNSGFRIWLVGRYDELYHTTPTDTAMKAALDVLEYKARKGPIHEVYLRIARLEDRIYWDLGNEKWEAIEITAQGWRVIDRPPVKFRRTRNTAELPHPVAGGSLDELQRLLKSPNEYWILIRGWLLDCLKGHKPYLILAVSGEHGTAKSTLLRCLRQIIDPLRKAELSSLPRDERDLGVDGESEYCLVYDNVSFLSPWLSDALCRVSTGAGIKTRRLYTDDEQAVFGFARPLALNGIPDFAENQDLLSRSLVIGQPTIWITACTGDTQFLDHLLENQTVAQEIALESSPVVEVLLQWVRPKGNRWQGNCKELLEALRSIYRDRGEYDKLKDLPKTPRALSGRLKRDAPAMRSLYKIDVKVAVRCQHKRLVLIEPLPA